MLVSSSSSPGFGKRGLMPLEGCIIDESLKVTDMHFKNDQTRRHVPIHCAPHKYINYFGICYFSCKKRSIRGCRPHPFPNEAVPRVAVIRFQQEQAPAVALLVPLKQAESQPVGSLASLCAASRPLLCIKANTTRNISNGTADLTVDALASGWCLCCLVRG